ncbi:MAG TPA: RHS repeat-associated core domain-containing protein [Paludibacter sp.]|nr:RHS repeat-associated core domain-containing protein [Paludibacter sp.]
MSGDGEGVLVNGALSGIRNGASNFTAYISPYLVVRNGGEYTKHIYMGGQRITSKVSNSGIFATSPVTTTDLRAKYDAQTASLKSRYDSLGVSYKVTPPSGGLVSSNPVATASSYFYHSDHLGSSSLITDQSGDIVQHLEYVPFGETFIDERRSQSSWTTPYLFSGKERDEETGLLYFGARYQDSKYGIWYSVDPLAEKYMNVGSYVYCLDNPVRFVDPDGRAVKSHVTVLWNKSFPIKMSDLGDTQPDRFWLSVKYNKSSKSYDVVFNVTERFSKGFKKSYDYNGKKHTLDTENPGLLRQIVAHEDGHVDQFVEKIKNAKIEIEYGGEKYSGRADKIVTKIFNEYMKNGTINDIKEFESDYLPKIQSVIEQKLFPILNQIIQGDSNLEQDANNRAEKKTGVTNKYGAVENNGHLNSNVQYKGKKLKLE